MSSSDPEVETPEFEIPDIVPATSDLPTSESNGADAPAQGAEPLPTIMVDADELESAPRAVLQPGVMEVIPHEARSEPTIPPSVPNVPRPTNPPSVPVAQRESIADVPSAGWGSVDVPVTHSAALRPAGRRPRVRKVSRVLRHIDPWSTFKVGAIFSAVTYVVLLTAGVLLWQVAETTGTIANVERWFTQFGWETFELHGDEIFDNAWVIGLFAAVGLTGAAVLFVTLFNLVSDIVGGVRMTVLEEEVIERAATSSRRYVVRRPALGDDAGASMGAEAWSIDDDEQDDAAPTAASTDFDDGGASPDLDLSNVDWSVDDDDVVQEEGGRLPG